MSKRSSITHGKQRAYPHGVDVGGGSGGDGYHSWRKKAIYGQTGYGPSAGAVTLWIQYAAFGPRICTFAAATALLPGAYAIPGNPSPLLSSKFRRGVADYAEGGVRHLHCTSRLQARQHHLRLFPCVAVFTYQLVFLNT